LTCIEKLSNKKFIIRKNSNKQLIMRLCNYKCEEMC
jgi:hypothetical protein